MERQIVIFGLADEDYGLDIDSVESIISMLPITAVPDAPEFVDGVTNLRGEVLPVVDLRKRLGLPLKEETKDTRIVVTEVDGSKVGIVVDEVSEVLRVAEEDIEPPSPLVAPVESDFIVGIAKAQERLIILLNPARLIPVGRREPAQVS
jgi:purine-binding chemotaxis protein CheW